jgi:hypothetical protein
MGRLDARVAVYSIGMLLVLLATCVTSMFGILSADLLENAVALPMPVAAGMSVASTLKRRPGRPRKFASPSRAVTLTLPETVLEALSAIHEDISRAVVHLVQRRGAAKPKPLAELSVFGRRAVITVRPTTSLEKRAGIQLVPLPDGRALISFEQPRTIAELELTLQDALDDPALAGEDRAVFQAIVTILKDARRSRNVSLHRRNIIVLESNGAGRRGPGTRNGA